MHMKNQALFSSKYKSKTIKCRLLQFLFGALRVKPSYFCTPSEMGGRVVKERKGFPSIGAKFFHLKVVLLSELRVVTGQNTYFRASNMHYSYGFWPV